MAKADVTNYSALTNEGNPFVQQQQQQANDTDNGELDSDDDNAHHSGIMIHVVPDTSKNRWNHIEDLDSFFTRMYNYHQNHGFLTMMVKEFLECCQFVFAVTFATFLFHCLNYPILFGEGNTNRTKITLDDVLFTTGECMETMSFKSWLLLLLAGLYCFFRSIKFCYHAVQFWDIKKFYNTALKIDDAELDNYTWHEVQRKIREVQSEQQMCIHKANLTELDIYHRILRFKNYMVAMMNKNMIPAKITLPITGEMVVYSRGLRYCIELILFRGPWSPFENNWHLKEEFKRSNKRIDLAQKLSQQITYIAIVYICMSPLVFFWELMVFFCSYGDLIKREPGTLGTRCWSQYGRLYLRHFNELDHELDARLNRAYRPAVRYMNSFSSPLMAVIAKNLVFMCGGVLSVLIVLTLYDEDVIQVQHIITIMSVLTIIVVCSRSFIPDENLIWCPEQLMTAVLAHIHYLPITWHGLAHTNRVRDQFGQFFQYRAVYLINEMLSPIVTPFILLFCLRPRALDIVDFFRNFTVSVVGVGDVCSFAQMDIRKHGNPDWQPSYSTTDNIPEVITPICETNQYTQGEHGKTELSLVHYTLTNPEWKMPTESKQFLQGLRKHAQLDMDATTRLGANTAMNQSLYSMGSMGDEYSAVVQSIYQNQKGLSSQMGFSTSLSPSIIRNPFSPTTNTATGTGTTIHDLNPQQRHQYDYQQMLQGHMSHDGSMQQHRSTLANIQEDDGTNKSSSDDDDDDEEGGHSREATESTRYGGNLYGRTTQSVLGTSMGASVRGLSRREGPAEGSQDGLLYSLCGQTTANNDTTANIEYTTANMCLSTLYLHELHHRQIKRRGLRLEQSHRQLWQRPHQQQSQSQQQSPLMPHSSSMHAGISHPTVSSMMAGPSTASASASIVAEKTPLLGQKKS